MNAISTSRIILDLADDDDTRQLGIDLAMALTKGALVFLEGDLGAGKTCLARALIRQIADQPELEVPSPTFAILQPYDIENHSTINEVVHADLYRLNDETEIDELGLVPLPEATVTLVEWPQKAGGRLGSPDITIRLETKTAGPHESREAIISGTGECMAAISRSLSIRQFLDDGWGKNIERIALLGDASTRSYEFAIKDTEKRILMNAPRQPDGPVIKDGKPYSQIANLAEDVSAFVGMDKILGCLDLRVPEIYHQDLNKGLLLLEDLGDGKIIDENRKPIVKRYLVAAELLAEFHGKTHPGSVEISDEVTHIIPPYNREAMLIEAKLLTGWYAPRARGAGLSKDDQAAFTSIWNNLIDLIEDSETKIVLRDFHSPNIIWREQEQGCKKAAIIDFQDGVMGPAAYDLASLAQDARVDVSQELESRILDHYCQIRAGQADFNEDLFRRDYAIMGALRTTKILGIFVRLDERDNKSSYLTHLPRIEDYIKRCMKHPALEPYRRWYESVIEL